MFDRIDDTIVAVSSAVGAGARGIIRLSGPQAIALGDRIFESGSGDKSAASTGSRRLQGQVRLSGGKLPAEAYAFHAPASYTRQNVFELHTIGSTPLLSMIVEELVASGARVAEPGEFTARAFFNGAMDLTNVEGVAAAISARSDTQLRASQALMHGSLARDMGQMREELLDLLALLEAEIDFVEEGIGFISRENAASQIQAQAQAIADTLDRAVSAERLETLPQVLLAGRPNAGKSTLFNRLTGTDRAIRSAVAGTTRDVLRAPVSLPHGDIMLCDSAGLAEEVALSERSRVDSLADRATRRAAASTDFAILLIDASDHAPGDLNRLLTEIPVKSGVVVFNKIDLLKARQAVPATAGDWKVLEVSAVTGEGISDLIAHLDLNLFTATQSRAGDLLALTTRQYDSLRQAHAALVRAHELLGGSRDLSACAELLALEVREAAHALSLLTGEATTEDLLARIFSRFCIGK